MLSLCNFLLSVNKKGACITYNSNLPIIPYPIVLYKCPIPFLIPYITLSPSIIFCPHVLDTLSFVRTYFATPTYHLPTVTHIHKQYMNEVVSYKWEDPVASYKCATPFMVFSITYIIWESLN